MRRGTGSRSKTAAGISIFLLEELGDARLRHAQLKKYIDEAMTLIEKSGKRDHFFEVAGNLIHGIPEILFKLGKALDAAALAAARLDYEETKNTLKPEKIEELERALQDVRIRNVQRRSDDESGGQEQAQDPSSVKTAMEFKFRIPVGPTTVKEVAKRLQHAGIDAHDGTEHVYGTIEGAGASQGHAQDDAAHKINQAAGSNIVRPHELRKGSGKENDMNAKTASEQLLKIAQATEATGKVPMPQFLSLLASLERGKRTASVAPDKLAGYMRGLAEGLAKEPNPSRHKLAAQLRRVLAEAMEPTSSQVAAAIYQQANSREDVMKGFKEANPDMSDADLEKAADMWEKHKDVVMDKN